MSGPESVWEEFWDRLNSFLAVLAESLLGLNPTIWWQAGHWDNEASPFWAWASFNRSGAAGVEDIVISLGFKFCDGLLVADIDIARGDGEVLAELAPIEIDLATDTPSLRAMIMAVETNAEEFIRQNEELLRMELAAAD